MILTTDKGVKIDMREQVNRLLLIARYGDFRGSQNLAYVDKLGRKLTVIAGPHAPGALLAGLGVEFAGEFDGEFGHHLATRWAEIVEEYQEMMAE